MNVLPTVAEVRTALRQRVGDENVEWTTDALCLEAIRYGYETTARVLRVAGIPVRIVWVAGKRVVASSSVTAMARGSGAQNFPADLVYPIDIGERTWGTAEDFQQVKRGGLFFWGAQGKELQRYFFAADTIYFPPVDNDRELMLFYDRQLPPLTGDSSQLLIPECDQAVVAYAAEWFSRRHDEVGLADGFFASGNAHAKLLADLYLAGQSARPVQYGQA